MITGISIVIGLALIVDAIIGDPNFKLHPVRLLGAFAARAETSARALFNAKAEKASPATFKLAGLVAWIAVLTIAVVFACTLSTIGNRLGTIPGLIADIFIIWASIAPSDLARHAMRIKRALDQDAKNGSAEPIAGREAVSMIVGRKVDKLSYSEVSRAAVESVAESSVDGVAAPLFWACAFGPVGAFAYRAINTMDSIYGHKNERYIFFGLVPARADDLANYLPARISAVLACAISPFLGFNAKGAFRSFRRYRLAHASPNAGHPESAYAGALGVNLGGAVEYEEGTVDKPIMNPEGREPEPADIRKSVALMYAQTVASAIAFLGLRWAILGLVK